MATQDKLQLTQTGMFLVRDFKEEDYQDFVNWYKTIKRAKGKYPSYEQLSTIGYVIEHENIKVSMGFLYITNSNIALISFVIANKEAPSKIRKKALKKLLTTLESKATNNSYDMVMILTDNPFFSKSLTEVDYLKGDSPHIEHIKIL